MRLKTNYEATDGDLKRELCKCSEKWKEHCGIIARALKGINFMEIKGPLSQDACILQTNKWLDTFQTGLTLQYRYIFLDNIL